MTTSQLRQTDAALMRAEFEDVFPDAKDRRYGSSDSVMQVFRHGYHPPFDVMYEGFEAGYNAAVSAMSSLGCDLMRAEFEKAFTDAHMHRNEKMRFGYLPQYQDLYEGFEAGYNAAVSAMSAPG